MHSTGTSGLVCERSYTDNSDHKDNWYQTDEGFDTAIVCPSCGYDRNIEDNWKGCVVFVCLFIALIAVAILVA